MECGHKNHQNKTYTVELTMDEYEAFIRPKGEDHRSEGQKAYETELLKWNILRCEQKKERDQILVREILARHVMKWKGYFFFRCPTCGNEGRTIHYMPFHNEGVCGNCLTEYSGAELAQALSQMEDGEIHE